MVQEREITIKIPESHARRIESVTGKKLEELVIEKVMNHFDDHRYRDTEVKRQGLGWQKEVYAAMLKHVGAGGISRFVREAVYEDLSKLEKDLQLIPSWKEGRQQHPSLKKRTAPEDRISIMAPIVFPRQWIDRIEARWPRKVGPYIKGVTQLKLEKLMKKTLPVQRGLGEFLDR